MSHKKSVHVDLEWLGGKRSIARIRGFTVSIDNPKDRGGTDAGPKPTELLLASLGGCFSIGVGYFAKKMRIDLQNLFVRLSGVQESEEVPRLTQITISVSA